MFTGRPVNMGVQNDVRVRQQNDTRVHGRVDTLVANATREHGCYFLTSVFTAVDTVVCTELQRIHRNAPQCHQLAPIEALLITWVIM